MTKSKRTFRLEVWLSSISILLVLTAAIADWIAYHDEPPVDLHVKLRIASVDQASKTFVASTMGGDQEVYRVDGNMPLGANQFVSLNYRTVFRWYRFFWQDENNIHINEVIEVF